MNSLFGVTLACFSLFMDGTVGSLQAHLMKEHAPTSNELMLYLNLWQLAGAAGSMSRLSYHHPSLSSFSISPLAHFQSVLVVWRVLQGNQIFVKVS